MNEELELKHRDIVDKYIETMHKLEEHPTKDDINKLANNCIVELLNVSTKHFTDVLNEKINNEVMKYGSECNLSWYGMITTLDKIQVISLSIMSSSLKEIVNEFNDECDNK